MADQFMQELVCSVCGREAHITWEGAGAAKRVVNMSESLEQHPGTPPTFTCTDCGTVQAAL
ncbi:MAG TPA: hypothetical protein VII48_00330 [Rhizomicrobium sp.]